MIHNQWRGLVIAVTAPYYYCCYLLSYLCIIICNTCNQFVRNQRVWPILQCIQSSGSVVWFWAESWTIGLVLQVIRAEPFPGRCMCKSSKALNNEVCYCACASCYIEYLIAIDVHQCCILPGMLHAQWWHSFHSVLLLICVCLWQRDHEKNTSSSRLMIPTGASLIGLSSLQLQCSRLIPKWCVLPIHMGRASSI